MKQPSYGHAICIRSNIFVCAVACSHAVTLLQSIAIHNTPAYCIRKEHIKYTISIHTTCCFEELLSFHCVPALVFLKIKKVDCD